MINLYNDDCLNILKQLKDKSVDLILTSPLYNMTLKKRIRFMEMIF